MSQASDHGGRMSDHPPLATPSFGEEIAQCLASPLDTHTVVSALREIAWAIRTHARATLIASGRDPDDPIVRLEEL